MPTDQTLPTATGREVVAVTTVRVRGIYATALTTLFCDIDDLRVVQASPPIRRRVDGDFADDPADVTVSTSDDRQGVLVAGDPGGVERVRTALADVGIDALSWGDPAAPGAVFEGEVTGTTTGGAIVSLGDAEGYLPFDSADGYVDEGDVLRVQVHESRAPWAGGRPVLDTELVVPGDVAALVRGVDALVADTPGGRSDHELVRTTDLLSTDVPANWGVRWEWGAEDVGVDALDAALADAVSTAEALEDALDDADGPGVLVAPNDAAWVWFGRDSRFALDERRRTVAPTMPGHHRVKAGSTSASTAVDFAEQLGANPEEFPFESVTDLFGPTEGDRVTIEHGKPDGRRLTLGRGEVVDRDVEKGRITVERAMTGGGRYDALEVPREAGDTATTRFTEGRWWYPTVYRDADGDVKGTYVNVSTPAELFPDSVRYVDLHVDVIKFPDGTVELVDEEELQASVDAGTVSPALAEKAMDVARQLTAAFES